MTADTGATAHPTALKSSEITPSDVTSSDVTPADSRLADAEPPVRRGRPVKLSCRGLWKLFGEDAEGFARRNAADIGGAVDNDPSMFAAVRDVDLSIQTGETFVIMGLSGSGKSTLVRCLSRLLDPSAGALELEGRDLMDLPKKELIEIRRHKMGMVFQHFALLPHLTVLENVAFPLSIQGMRRDVRDAKAMEMIDLVGLGGREADLPAQLSGGQKQRVGIARSLAVEPELWFLDEPFSALDPLIRRDMQDELMRLQKVLNKTIIFITHDFDEAIRIADRIAIMKDGAIVQVGTPEEIVCAPADTYVSEFTRDVPRAKVMTARSILRTDRVSRAGASRDGLNNESVDIDARLETIARQVVAADAPVTVTDEGRAVGVLRREDVISVLAGLEVDRG